MKINNTNNSTNFRGRFFVVGHAIDENTLRLYKNNIRGIIHEGCFKCGIPSQALDRDEWVGETCEFFFKQPFITGQEDVSEYRNLDYPHPNTFIPQENTLDLFEVLKAIQKGKFDFLNGKILK